MEEPIFKQTKQMEWIKVEKVERLFPWMISFDDKE